MDFCLPKVADVLFLHDGAGSLNLNTSIGTQRNHSQCEGSGNKQYNADNIIITELHDPQSCSEKPPLPLSNVPFRHDPDFVERGDLLKQIENKLSRPAARFALAGLGGVGKTQLAIEYCLRLRERARGIWIFWVHASNSVMFHQGLRNIAEHVKLTMPKDAKPNIPRLLHTWLCSERNGPWLIVLDNVDDSDYLLELNSEDNLSRRLYDYFPMSPNGRILITTRNRSAVEKLVYPKEILSIQPMTPENAVELLEKKFGSSAGHHSILDLASTLGYMPLALSQAAAFITQYKLKYSIEQYLEDFRHSEKSRMSILKYNGVDISRDLHEANNSILITWQVSFEYIRQKRQTAADLLSLMAFFNKNGIPTHLLQEGYAQYFTERLDIGDPNYIEVVDNDQHLSNDDNNCVKGTLTASIMDSYNFDIKMLRDYSMFSVEKSGEILEMHQLVQLGIKTWLESRGEMHRWKRTFCSLLYSNFPGRGYEYWGQCRLLYPHVKCASELVLSAGEETRQWASLLNKAAWYAVDQGAASDVAILSSRAMEATRREYGEESEATLACLSLLALSKQMMNSLKEAEKLGEQVVEAQKRALGEQHPDTLTSMSNLAATYWGRRQYRQAEELTVRVLDSRRKVLGEEHIDTLRSTTTLVSRYLNQGQHRRAKELAIPVIEAQKRAFGEEHPETLQSMSYLISIYSAQGQYKEAKELGVKVLESQNKVLGNEHPDTLKTMSSLVLIYVRRGQYKEAEELGVQALKGRKRVFGEEHPDTLNSMSGLVLTYIRRGNYEEAEELAIQVLKTLKKVLGEDHPAMLRSMFRLALVYERQGRYTEADELNVQVLEGRKVVLGEEHPDTLDSMSSLVLTYIRRLQFKEAAKLAVRVLDTRKKTLEEDHPATLRSKSNLALLYQTQGQYTEAEELYLKVLYTRKRVLGEDHPATLKSMSSLASTLEKQGKYKEAERILIQVLKARKKVLGEEHPDTLTSMSKLAATYRSEEKYREMKSPLAKKARNRTQDLTLATFVGNELDTPGNWSSLKIPVVLSTSPRGRRRERGSHENWLRKICNKLS